MGALRISDFYVVDLYIWVKINIAIQCTFPGRSDTKCLFWTTACGRPRVVPQTKGIAPPAFSELRLWIVHFMEMRARDGSDRLQHGPLIVRVPRKPTNITTLRVCNQSLVFKLEGLKLSRVLAIMWTFNHTTIDGFRDSILCTRKYITRERTAVRPCCVRASQEASNARRSGARVAGRAGRGALARYFVQNVQ